MEGVACKFMDESEYTLITRWEELERYKGKVLMFGYWEPGAPSYGWAAVYRGAKSVYDGYDPTLSIKHLTVFTDRIYATLYQMELFEVDGEGKVLGPCKDDLEKMCGDVADRDNGWTSFDGQLFIRTLNKKEKEAYRKVMRRKTMTYI